MVGNRASGQFLDSRGDPHAKTLPGTMLRPAFEFRGGGGHRPTRVIGSALDRLFPQVLPDKTNTTVSLERACRH